MSNLKTGLDYFPLSVNIDADDKMALIQAKHGIEGFTTIIKMFIKIYSDKGYFYEWTEEKQLLFANRISVPFDKIIIIIKDALKWEIFDNEKYKKYQILTSKKIQEVYLEATKRRKRVEIFKSFLMINSPNVNILNQNVYIVDENAVICTQSKVKESKGKEKESKVKYADDVLMTSKEHEKLVEEYGEETTKKMIKILDNYKGSKGKTYKSDYKAILSWVVDKVLKEDKKKGDWKI